MPINDLERKIANALDDFSLEDILDMNDITVEELLQRLVEDGTITLPNEEI